ncbi:NAD(P)/FAD-dependent oxidoreductase [Tunturiibacter lichenicola]|uniref:NAD(P)/FAD-dependent oxidoreductase n=1 Tax=Tunturiibacter lichenicola TaxID=2051959 RepID=UPI003D9BC6C5
MSLSRFTSQPDVLIVGAGPAGLASAIAAANQGIQVEVIDARKPPIDKACGEGLLPASLESLAALGFDLRDLLHIESYPLRGIRFLNDKNIAEAAFPLNSGRGIRRTVLHELLVDQAESLGVRFHWENAVRAIELSRQGPLIRTNRQTLTTRYLIGADGHQSRVSAAAGLNAATTHSRRIGLSQHYAIAPWTNFVEIYWSDHGQAYVTPTSSNEVCVAYVANQRSSTPAEALSQFPILQHRLANTPLSGAARGSITLGRTLHTVATENIALIGDASGSVDAITGEGLALCFRQAAALATALRNDDLTLYQQTHRHIQRLPSLMSRALLLLDRSPRLRNQLFRAFERRPLLFQQLLQIHIRQSPLRVFGTDGLLAAGLQMLTS